MKRGDCYLKGEEREKGRELLKGGRKGRYLLQGGRKGRKGYSYFKGEGRGEREIEGACL